MTLLTPNRVLIVDDEPGMLQMLKAVLSQYGFVTEEARDGREAMELLGKKPFDVIVSDVNMPRYPGLEFLRGVREKDPDIPVIMMTGKPTVEASSRALEYGAFRYLIKPVMPVTLKDAVQRAIQLHELARAKRKALQLFGVDDKWLGERPLVEAGFGRAIEGLWLAVQPIISWKDQRVYGYEALVRSTEPTLPHPGVLLEAAERLDKLEMLSRAVRSLAAKISPPGDAKLFVNLHSRDLVDEELYSPDAPLSRIAHRVVLEITERASLEGIADLGPKLAKLRHLGFQLAVDDLGAGYAGLTTFTQLEPDVVKIDMSLVRNLDKEVKKRTIVSRLRELCAEMHIDVIAEGVETKGERDALVAFGCDKLQGFLFARPAAPFPTVSWNSSREMSAPGLGPFPS
jgi:EAL domain-containing protein (putative c-di-GMP-specific phosphodiesterase class I)